MAARTVTPLIYQELYKLALERSPRRAGWNSVSPTALVNEAYVRLMGGKAPMEWESRRHFFAVSAIVMRRLVLDAARRRRRMKRGRDWKQVPLEGVDAAAPEPRFDALEITEALQRLAAVHPRQAQIAEWRIFVGLSTAEIAHLLGLSPRMVQLSWAHARGFLMLELQGPPPA